MQWRDEVPGWRRSLCSVSHSPMTYHFTGRKIRRPRSPCMACLAPYFSSELISLPYPVPSLVFQTYQAHPHPRAFALAVCFAWSTLSPGGCAVPSHLSGLCSNISISGRPSKNSQNGINSSLHTQPPPSTKIFVPQTQDFVVVVVVLCCNPCPE